MSVHGDFFIDICMRTRKFVIFSMEAGTLMFVVCFDGSIFLFYTENLRQKRRAMYGFVLQWNLEIS